MKYFKSFNQRLAEQRRKKKLTQDDLALICQVDPVVVAAWESLYESQRAYPEASHLIDLCVKAGMHLEQLIDLDASPANIRQFELPGFSSTDEKDLTKTVEELQSVLENLLPDEQERALLKRFRNADADKRRFILQLIGP